MAKLSIRFNDYIIFMSLIYLSIIIEHKNSIQGQKCALETT